MTRVDKTGEKPRRNDAAPAAPNQAAGTGFRRIGKDVMIWEGARIGKPEMISIGNSVLIDSFVFITGGQGTTIGDFVHIAPFASCLGGGVLTLEDFCGLATGARVHTGTDDVSGGCLTNPTVPFPYSAPKRSFVHLKKHAWVGPNAVVLPGVVIGEGAVIVANSVVMKDCEPWGVYLGSPARKVEQRPKEKILEYEKELRARVFDAAGNYVSKENWDFAGSGPDV